MIYTLACLSEKDNTLFYLSFHRRLLFVTHTRFLARRDISHPPPPPSRVARTQPPPRSPNIPPPHRSHPTRRRTLRRRRRRRRPSPITDARPSSRAALALRPHGPIRAIKPRHRARDELRFPHRAVLGLKRLARLAIFRHRYRRRRRRRRVERHDRCDRWIECDAASACVGRVWVHTRTETRAGAFTIGHREGVHTPSSYSASESAVCDVIA